MSTTPLPPLPTPWIHDLSADEGSQQHFAADQMQAYAQQARADLEVENARLREALQEITDDYADRFNLESPSTNPGIKYVIKQARAALKGTP